MPILKYDDPERQAAAERSMRASGVTPGATAKERREARHEKRLASGKAVGGKISDVGDTSSGVLACPRCGGTQFKARRGKIKRAALVGMAVATPLTKQTQVQCVTCGARYKRG